MNRIGHMRDLDLIVTDSELDIAFKDICATEGVELHVADSFNATT